MTPALKVGHVGVGFSVQSLVVHHFVVVHHVGDDFVDFVRVNAIGNVLTVAGGGAKGAIFVSLVVLLIYSTGDGCLRIMVVVAGVGQSKCRLGQGFVPGKSWSRVVGTVDVVRVEDQGLVGRASAGWGDARCRAGLNSGGGGGGSSCGRCGSNSCNRFRSNGGRCR